MVRIKKEIGMKVVLFPDGHISTLLMDCVPWDFWIGLAIYQ